MCSAAIDSFGNTRNILGQIRTGLNCLTLKCMMVMMMIKFNCLLVRADSTATVANYRVTTIKPIQSKTKVHIHAEHIRYSSAG
jgi:hypothetical protein